MRYIYERERKATDLCEMLGRDLPVECLALIRDDPDIVEYLSPAFCRELSMQLRERDSWQAHYFLGLLYSLFPTAEDIAAGLQDSSRRVSSEHCSAGRRHVQDYAAD